MTEKLPGLNCFNLKIIAIIAMTIDHIGLIFFPNKPWMRMIGRLTFPIMAFLIYNGYTYTKDIKKYLKRLLLFALISAYPFYLLFNWPFNVFFTLCSGLFALYITENINNKLCRFIIVLLISLATIFCDWGFIGVIAIYLMGRIDTQNSKITIPILLLFFYNILSNYIVDTIINKYPLNFISWLSYKNAYMYLGVLFTIPLLYLYNNKKGYSIKYFFYIYYPLHLLIIAFIYLYS